MNQCMELAGGNLIYMASFDASAFFKYLTQNMSHYLSVQLCPVLFHFRANILSPMHKLSQFFIVGTL